MPYCVRCGTTVADERTYCRNCGAQQPAATTRPVPNAQAASVALQTPADPNPNIPPSPTTHSSFGVAADAPPYESAALRAAWAKVALVTAGAAAALSVLVTLNEIDLLVRLRDQPFEVTTQELAHSDSYVRTPVTVYLGALMFAVVAYCFWIHRAYRNLLALDQVRPRFSPGWAIGWYFVPVMNLFRPYQVMSEIWRTSDPVRPPHERAEGRAVSPLIGW